jgi:hypothetical protein
MSDKKKAAPDWERIECDYRAGLLSVREIAASQGITHGAINKRAKRDAWTRDLAAKIKAKADALVSKREVSSLVSAERVATENAIVDANAQVIANIRIAHRTDINRSRKLVMGLLGELEEQTENIDLYRQLGELMQAPDDKGVDKLNELYHKVISLGGRTSTMKSLSDSLKTLVTLEREAYGLAVGSTGDEGSDGDKLVVEIVRYGQNQAA